MATKYSYTISTDFNGNLNSSQFQNEVEADPGIAPTCNYIDTSSDNVDVCFSSSLSAGEQTTLNGLVAAHVPLLDIGIGSYGESDSQLSTSSTSYIQKYRLTLANIVSGNYFIEWSACIGNSDKSKPVLFRVQIDDTTTICECGETLENSFILSKIISVFKRENLSVGSHNIDMDIKSSSDGGTAQIKNVRIRITKE